MKLAMLRASALAAIMGAAAGAPATKCNSTGPSTPATTLQHWPSAAASALDAMIRRHAHSGAYAVFDMDNTAYRFDLEESLLPYLESRGVLTRAGLDPSLRIIPFADSESHSESLYSYYLRLCAVDDAVCYPWVAQVFSGIPLRELKAHVDELMALEGTVATTVTADNGTVVPVEVSPPRPFRGQQELFGRLMDNGIAVYVMTAASEELVRMVASDPRYGYNVPAQNVVGVTMLMTNLTDPAAPPTTSRKQIAEGRYDQAANLRDMQMTPYLWTPATWKAGKHAAILTYIDEWRMPVLVAGDTPDGDGYMLFHATDVKQGGVRVWVNRKESSMKKLQGMIDTNTRRQTELGLEVTANKNWVIVKPEEIL
ncbi:hypothetical protein RB601_001822 [Gaeumannomyces tritici]